MQVGPALADEGKVAPGVAIPVECPCVSTPPAVRPAARLVAPPLTTGRTLRVTSAGPFATTAPSPRCSGKRARASALVLPTHGLTDWLRQIVANNDAVGNNNSATRPADPLFLVMPSASVPPPHTTLLGTVATNGGSSGTPATDRRSRRACWADRSDSKAYADVEGTAATQLGGLDLAGASYT